jgi:DNA polymerase alpha subunit B
MAECWEAFSLNRKVSELTDHTFSSYKAQLIKDLELTGATLPVTTTRDDTHVDGAVQTRPGLGKRHSSDGLNMVTPPAKRHDSRGGGTKAGPGLSSSPQVSSHRSIPPVKSPKYAERVGVGEVVASFQPQSLPVVNLSAMDSRRPTKCVISSSFPTNVTKPYRHMFSTIQDRAHALDDHLAALKAAIIQQHGIRETCEDSIENTIAPLEAVYVPRQDKVCCIGRICNEAHDGKLNSTSVVLEGARNTCGGARINVDLSHMKGGPLKDYSLFPGQIVAIEGMNSTGRKLVAHRICEGAAHPHRTTSIRQLRRFHYDLQDGSPVKVMTVCGPYTTSENLEYEPFLDLLNNILEASPDVVILTGPFVDMGHEEVHRGELKIQVENEDGVDELMVLSHEAFFANKIAGLIEDLYNPEQGNEDLHTQFVLVPSLEDATAQWV